MVRLVCLTVIPHGGSLAPALKKLGFVPYSFRTVFQGTNVRSHPEQWSALLSGAKSLDNLDFLKHCDCLIGPPSTLLYDHILKLCPPYTKVILIEQPNKKKWADTYNNFLAAHPCMHSRRRSSEDRVRRAYYTLIERMMVGSNVPSLKNDLRTSSASKNQPVPPSALSSSCSVATRAQALENFEEKVRQTVPRGRLLVFREEDGWGPLCQFLGVDVRREPFPSYDPTTDDYGLQVLKTVEDRLDRVKLLHFLVKLVSFSMVCVFFAPYLSSAYQSVKTTYSEYRYAYAEIPPA